MGVGVEGGGKVGPRSSVLSPRSSATSHEKEENSEKAPQDNICHLRPGRKMRQCHRRQGQATRYRGQEPEDMWMLGTIYLALSKLQIKRITSALRDTQATPNATGTGSTITAYTRKKKKTTKKKEQSGGKMGKNKSWVTFPKLRKLWILRGTERQKAGPSWKARQLHTIFIYCLATHLATLCQTCPRLRNPFFCLHK